MTQDVPLDGEWVRDGQGHGAREAIRSRGEDAVGDLRVGVGTRRVGTASPLARRGGHAGATGRARRWG